MLEGMCTTTLEKDLEEAQNAFAQQVLESIANINCVKFKLRLCAKKLLNSDNMGICKQFEITDASGNQDLTDNKIRDLQRALERSIAKNGLSIKRSLMKFNSLLAQHHLLFLPFYELKAYYNQLLDLSKIDITNLETQIKPKLSYEEALRNIEQISSDIDLTKKAILDLSEEQNHLDFSMVSHSYYFTDEYKKFPQFSAFCSKNVDPIRNAAENGKTDINAF